MTIQDEQPHILYTKDNSAIRCCIHSYLICIGYQADIVITSGETWVKYLANPYEIILLDSAMLEHWLVRQMPGTST